METIKIVEVIFREIFDDDKLVLTRETSPKDIEGWDSLVQINIILALQDEFNIEFELKDILELKNVGDICDLVSSRL